MKDITNHITAIINRVRKIYADTCGIKLLDTMGSAPIPPSGIWEFDSIQDDMLFSNCARYRNPFSTHKILTEIFPHFSYLSHNLALYEAIKDIMPLI